MQILSERAIPMFDRNVIGSSLENWVNATHSRILANPSDGPFACSTNDGPNGGFPIDGIFILRTLVVTEFAEVPLNNPMRLSGHEWQGVHCSVGGQVAAGTTLP